MGEREGAIHIFFRPTTYDVTTHNLPLFLLTTPFFVGHCLNSFLSTLNYFDLNFKFKIFSPVFLKEENLMKVQLGLGIVPGE